MPDDKPLLVFVPGLGATGEVYEPFLEHMREDYTVAVAMHSLRFPEKLDWQFFFDAIDEAAGQTERFVLVGHSMGGATALKYAATHPERIIKVIAVAPPMMSGRRESVKGLAAFRWYRRLQNLGLGLLSAQPWHALKTVRIRAKVLAHGRRKQLYAWTHAIDLSKDLPKLRHATVFWPKREELLSPSHFDAVRKHPNITSRPISGSHNYLPLNPRRLIRPIREVLRG